MTERIYSGEQFSLLPQHGVEAQKIRALFLGYGTGYDFCRFFRQGSTYLAALDGSFVICAQPETDWQEIAEFISMHGFTDIFCSQESAERLKKLLNAQFTDVALMERSAERSEDVRLPECTPSQAWDIISTRFDIEFEPWYLDMSHRVRHGISKCISDGKAALVVQHSINGETMLSQVAVLEEYEHTGRARGIINAVCNAYGSTIQVICEEKLTAFYEKCGFRRSGNMTAAVRN